MQNNDNSKNMANNFGNATFTGNTNFQSDSNTQSFQQGSSDINEKLFTDLIDEINKIHDEQEKNDNLSDAENLKQAIANKNIDRAKNFFGMLGKTIQVSAAGVSLAKAFDLFPAV